MFGNFWVNYLFSSRPLTILMGAEGVARLLTGLWDLAAAEQMGEVKSGDDDRRVQASAKVVGRVREWMSITGVRGCRRGATSPASGEEK